MHSKRVLITHVGHMLLTAALYSHLGLYRPCRNCQLNLLWNSLQFHFHIFKHELLCVGVCVCVWGEVSVLLYSPQCLGAWVEAAASSTLMQVNTPRKFMATALGVQWEEARSALMSEWPRLNIYLFTDGHIHTIITWSHALDLFSTLLLYSLVVWKKRQNN